MFTVYIDRHTHIGSWRAHPQRHIMNLRSHTGIFDCKHLFVSIHAAGQAQSLLFSFVDLHKQRTQQQKLKGHRTDGHSGTAALGWARSEWASLTRLRLPTGSSRCLFYDRPGRYASRAGQGRAAGNLCQRSMRSGHGENSEVTAVTESCGVQRKPCP